MADLSTKSRSVSPSPPALADPAQWSVADVRAWLNLQATQLQLPPLILSFWNLGGPALLKLTEAEFRQLAPVGGELLYAQLEIWRGALRAVPKAPQYQHWQRYHLDHCIMQGPQLPQQQQQVPQNNHLESPSPLGSPSHQLGSQSQLGSPSHQLGTQSQLGSPSHQLGSQSQLGSPSHQLGSPGHLAPTSQLGSPNYLGSPSSPPMSLTANMSQVPTPVVQVTQQQQQQHLQAGGAGTCQPQPAPQAPQPPQQQQQQQQASGGVYLEEQRLDMTALLQQQANSPKAAHPPRVPAHSPQDDAYDSDDEAEDDGCGSGNTSSGRGGTHIHLWQFLKGLLEQPQPYGSCIRWIDRQKAVFKIEDSVRVARLWGKRKNRPAMNYDKLSRSIRQYYKKGIMKKTERSQRLVYQFCHPYCL